MESPSVNTDKGDYTKRTMMYPMLKLMTSSMLSHLNSCDIYRVLLIKLAEHPRIARINNKI